MLSTKILVLGDSGVGKSSLIHLICHDSVLSSAQWTIGCYIDVKLHDNHFLEFWDIGGSRSHKIARSFLYDGYHGIMLVFDATNKKSRSNLHEWLVEVTQKTNDKDLENFVNSNVPVIRVATKYDQLPRGSARDIDEECLTDVVVDDQAADKSAISGSLDNYTHRRRPLAPPIINGPEPAPSVRLSSSGYSSTSLNSLSSLSPALTGSSDPLRYTPVIYVNTQDAQSFKKNVERDKLDVFFRHVVDRRNKMSYNKFVI